MHTHSQAHSLIHINTIHNIVYKKNITQKAGSDNKKKWKKLISVVGYIFLFFYSNNNLIFHSIKKLFLFHSTCYLQFTFFFKKKLLCQLRFWCIQSKFPKCWLLHNECLLCNDFFLLHIFKYLWWVYVEFFCTVPVFRIIFMCVFFIGSGN